MSGLNILIVDDERDFAAALGDLLRVKGYGVAIARDAVGAKEALDRCCADIALIDIGLGAENGLDMIPALRRRQPDMVCIIMSGNNESDIVIQALRAGVDDFLSKPLDTALLFSSLDRAIAERDRIRATHRKNEQRLRDIMEASADFTWEMDEDLRFSFFSDKFSHITGMPQDALLGKTRAETVLPDVDPDDWENHLADLAAHRSFRNFEHRRIKPDGSRVHLSVNGKAVFDDNGVFLGYRGSVRNITKRMEAEEALRRAHGELERRVEERTQELLDINSRLVQEIADRNKAEAALRLSEEHAAEAYRAAKITFWEWNKDCDKITYRPGAYVQMTGDTHTTSPSSNTEYLPYVLEEDRDRVRECYAHSESAGLDYDIEYRISRGDGEVRSLREIAKAVFDGDGRFIGQVGTAQDITEMRARDIALRESEARLVEAHRIARLGHWGWNVDTDDLWWSDEIFRIFGYKPQAFPVSYDSIAKFIHPDDFEMISKIDKASVEGHTPDPIEYRIKRPDGEIRTIEERSKPLFDGAGKVIAVSGTIQDISDRKRIEDALRGSEKRFRDLLELAPDAMVVVNRQGEIILVNRQTEAIFGYQRDALVGRSVEILIPGEIRDRHIKLRTGFFADPQVRPMGRKVELFGVARDGRRFPVEISLSPIDTDEGEMVAATIRDITERKQAEQALRVNEERYALAVAGTTDGIWDWNVQSGEHYFSPRWKAVLGYGEDEIEPHVDSFFSRIHPDDRTRVDDAVRAFFDDRKPYGIEYRMRHKAGHYVWVHSRAQAIWDDEGKPLRMSGAMTDITGRRAAEEKIRTRDAWLRGIMENTPLQIVLKDTEGRILAVSRNVAVTHGLLQEDFVGHTSDEFLPAKTAKIHMEADRQVIRHDRLFQQEYAQENRDGSIQHWLNAKFPLKDNKGETIGICNLSTDITEIKAVQAQLNQAQKMEAVGQLTGGIAHDFNNLLAIVMGNLELIEDEMDEDDPMGVLLQAAFSAADDAATLTHRLLAFSRNQPLMPQVADVNSLVRNMIDLFGRALDETIHIKTAFMDGLAPVSIDPGQLENALLNLVVNARHAMVRGGEIYIETGGVTLTEGNLPAEYDVAPGDYISLTVRDTGTGMTKDVLDHVFEPFFTTKEVGEGSGLGLSMVFGFVKQSGGYVTIESDVGKGTTVSLFLPASEDDADAGEAAEALAPDLWPGAAKKCGGETILFVEDDERILNLIVDQLADLGYVVLRAKDAASALATLDETPGIDLLLTDVMLPGGMDGAELAKVARQRRPELPVLYASGYTADSLMERGQIEDGAELIEKPFKKRDLAAKIAAMLAAS